MFCQFPDDGLMHRRLFHAAILAIGILAIVCPGDAWGQHLGLDYRYLPPRWHTLLGLPGDWHKPMVNEKGALVYDFGPGPYAIPGTEISIGVKEDSVIDRQQTVSAPRIPIVRTESRGTRSDMVTEAFSVLPSYDWQQDGAQYEGDVQRINGLTGTVAWANPEGKVDPAFRNVAYGTNRPIAYRIRVEPRGQRKVVLGFADSYRKQGSPVRRVMTLAVEGDASQDIDVVDRVGQNVPMVVAFEAQDTDGDGWLEIRIEAQRETVDGNLFLNVIWVFPAQVTLDETALIRGDLSNQAEMYVDCGRDLQVVERGPRMDLLQARISRSDGPPIVQVRTKRTLHYDQARHLLRSFEAPFILVQPHPVSAHETDQGWELTLPAGTDEVIVAVSQAGHGSVEVPEMPEMAMARERLSAFWLDEARLPWDKIQVSDADVQALFEGSIRTMYQLTERVDGDLQTQPGPSVYRGLWVSNQPRVGRAFTHLGDVETTRSSLARTFSFQQDDGQVLVLSPATLLKETGIAMHAVYLHARMSRDRSYLESYWPKLQKAAAWILQSRQQTTDPEALNYGLMPAGLSDGGVGGIVPEYTTVYWSMLGIKGMIDGAQWLGKPEQAAAYHAGFSDFMAAFRRAAARDVKQDAYGHWFLPIRMAFDPEKHTPQRTQTQFSHMVYPGRLFEKEDPLVEGNMRMLAAAPKAEGLLLSTGWLNNGVQPFIESTRAGVWLYLDNVEAAQEILYAVANHAAPTHVWIEEQLPGSGPRRATGDVPHSSACSEFINLVRYFMALEEQNHLSLLKGIPSSWIYPGATLRANQIPTEFGDLTLRVDISADGHTAQIKVAPVEGETDSGGLRIHMGAFKSNGFTLPNGQALPDIWGGAWGEEVVVKIERE